MLADIEIGHSLSAQNVLQHSGASGSFCGKESAVDVALDIMDWNTSLPLSWAARAALAPATPDFSVAICVALRISADRLQMGAEGGRVDAEEEREALGKQAVRWLQEAADAGFVPACLELGLIYLARSCFASSILASGFSMEG